MKRLFIIALVLAAAACSRTKTIPDGELADIFREIYLTNAWCASTRTVCDSLDIYEPIFAAHGYTAEDFVTTLSNFSRRKSSRLSDVVDRAIAMLETEEKEYARRVEVLNLVDSMAQARTADTVYRGERIRISRIKDTALLRITLPVREGSYDISYGYLIDSADRNRRIQARFEVYDSLGSQLSSSGAVLRGRDTVFYTTRVEVGPQGTELVIRPALYPEKAERPSMTVDSLTAVRYAPLREALERLYRESVDYNLLIDGKRYDAPPDSGALYVLPPAAYPPPDSLAGD